MITYKEKLVMFVKLKKKHIEKFGFIYANHEDYENIRYWPEKKCKNIYDYIIYGITSPCESRGLSDLTCPWCVYHSIENDPCLLCSYGKRHGKCEEKGSLYKKYATREVKDFFTNEVYLDIVNEIES